MTNNDIAYVSEHLDEVHENLTNSEGTVDGLLMHYTNGDINAPTMDRAILKSIRDQIVEVCNLIQAYDIELQARAH